MQGSDVTSQIFSREKSVIALKLPHFEKVHYFESLS